MGWCPVCSSSNPLFKSEKEIRLIVRHCLFGGLFLFLLLAFLTLYDLCNLFLIRRSLLPSVILFPLFCLETKGGAKNSSPFDADQSFMRQVFRRMGDRTTPKSDSTHTLSMLRSIPSYGCVAMEVDVYCARRSLWRRRAALNFSLGKA